jgi:hypothetical protein
MLACVYACICVYAYISSRTRDKIMFIGLCADLVVGACLCMYVCMLAFVYACICVHVYISLRTRNTIMFIGMCADLVVGACICVYVCLHLCKRAYVYVCNLEN